MEDDQAHSWSSFFFFRDRLRFFVVFVGGCCSSVLSSSVLVFSVFFFLCLTFFFFLYPVCASVYLPCRFFFYSLKCCFFFFWGVFKKLSWASWASKEFNLAFLAYILSEDSKNDGSTIWTVLIKNIYIYSCAFSSSFNISVQWSHLIKQQQKKTELTHTFMLLQRALFWNPSSSLSELFDKIKEKLMSKL